MPLYKLRRAFKRKKKNPAHEKSIARLKYVDIRITLYQRLTTRPHDKADMICVENRKYLAPDFLAEFV